MLRFRPVPAASGAGCRRNCAPLFRMNLLQLYEDLATRERLDFGRGRSVCGGDQWSGCNRVSDSGERSVRIKDDSVFVQVDPQLSP
jgi:hypothetical protein